MTMLNSKSDLLLSVASETPHRANEIIVARLTDTRTGDRRAAVVAPAGQFVLGVALRPTRARLLSGREMIFDGVMASGMTYVCRPSQTLHAEFAGPTDILHLYVAGGSIHTQQHAEMKRGRAL